MSLGFINPKSLDSDMKAIGAEIREMMQKTDRSIEITFKPAKRSKTRAQLAYYNILLRMLAKECGYTVINMDTTIKDELGFYNDSVINGVERRVYKSKSGCTIEEATIFVDTIMGLCDEMNIRYLSPEQYYEKIRFNR